MKKRTRQLVIMAAALVILGGAFLTQSLIEKRKAEEAALAAEEAAKQRELENDYEFTRFIPFEGDQIVKIEMISPEETAVLEKAEDAWTLVSPAYDVIPSAIQSAGNSVLGVGSSTVVEEVVKDWSIYGIDESSPRAIIHASTGESVTLIIGDSSPTGSGSYINIEGETRVFMTYSYSADNLIPRVDEWRNRALPQVNPQAITYIKIEGDRTIEMVPTYEIDDFARVMSTMLMVQPFEKPVPISSDKVGKYLEAMLSEPLAKINFIEEGFTLAELGLDEASARRLTLRDQENSVVDLLIGNPASAETFVNRTEIQGQFGMEGYTQETKLGKEEYYARIPGTQEVFTISGAWGSLADATPFELRDNFVRLVNIDDVEAWSFTYKGESWGGRIEREGEGDDLKESYFFNGFEAPEDDFKDIYQDILYVVFEGEIKEGPLKTIRMTPEATIRYIGTPEKGGGTRADFYPYDDLFYSVSIDGAFMNFLVGRYQIEDIVKNMRAVDF